MMNKTDFTETVVEKLTENLGPNYKVQVSEVNKINCVRTGLVIAGIGETICPTIYLDDFFSHFTQGRSINSIIHEIIQIYEANRNPKELNVNAANLLDFDVVKEKIVTKVINAEKNVELLKTVPHILLFDLGLAVIFYVDLGSTKEYRSRYLVQNSHLNLWNISPEKLAELAKKNIHKKYHLCIRSIEDIICELTHTECEDIPMVTGMYVLTDTETQTLGASGLFYTEKIREFAKDHSCNMYILPSSVNELILLQAEDDMDIAMLRDMVQTVNKTEVSEEEFLSDDVFLYVSSQDTIIKL